ncbi:MAG: hypothetical protein ABGY41_00955 [Candidatus Poribacteria bacterium]
MSAFTVTNAPTRVEAGSSETIAVEFLPTQDGALTGNILVAHDGLDSPLSIPVSGSGTSNVSLTVYVSDSLGFEWDIRGDGGINDGTSDAYDGAHRLDVDGDSFPSFSVGTADGRELTIGPATLGVVEVTRQVYVPADNAFARYLDVIENTTDAPQTVTVGMHTNLGSDSSTEVIATSSGDATTDASDHWVVTDDSIDGYGGSDPVVVHVVSGPGGAVVADALTAGSDYYDDVDYSYTLTLAVGEKVALLQFAVQRHTPDDAIAAAEELAALLGGATDGLTEDELALVRNFDPDAVADVDVVEADVRFGGGWTLFSLPAPSPQGTLAALAAYDVDTINAWDAETQGYEIVTDGSLEHVAKGYFVHRDAALGAVDATLEVEIEASEAASVDLTIEAGWNLGGVVDGGLTLGDVTSYPNTVFGWDGTSYSPANQLRPYEGYWVYNPGDAYDVTLTQLRYRANTPGAPAVRSAPEPAWVTSLVATGRDGGTATVSVGSGERASAGYDRMDIAVPPSPGAAERVSVYAVEDGSADVDF